jgi:hypothetical protein
MREYGGSDKKKEKRKAGEGRVRVRRVREG